VQGHLPVAISQVLGQESPKPTQTDASPQVTSFVLAYNVDFLNDSLGLAIQTFESSLSTWAWWNQTYTNTVSE